MARAVLGMLTIQAFNDYLTMEGRTIERVPWCGRAVQAYIPERFADLLHNDLHVIHNGQALPVEELPFIFPADGDTIAFCPKFHGIESALVVALITTLVSSIVSFGINYLISLIVGEPNKAFDEGKQQFFFDPLQNTIRSGTPIPVIYGEHRTGGQILQYFTRPYTLDGPLPGQVERGDQLFMLLGLSEGQIESVGGKTASSDWTTEAATPGSTPEDILINGNNSDNYVKSGYAWRMGVNGQSEIPQLGDSTTVQVVDLVLDFPFGESPVPLEKTTADPATAFEVLLTFTNGLYAIGGQGKLHQNWVDFKIRWRVNGGAYEPADVLDFTIQDLKRTAFTVRIRKDGLASNIYDVEVSKQKANTIPKQPDQKADIVDIVKWNALHAITDDGQIYPNLALLAITLKADKSLSGTAPRISSVIKGKKVQVWDGVDPINPTFTTIFSANPAWIAYDLITNKRYGLGFLFDATNVDLESFSAWASFCTMKSFEFNAVLQEPRPAWEVLQSVMASGRAALVKTGRSMKIKIDEARDPVQMFTMGNIMRGTFTMQYNDTADRPNFIAVQFRNRTKEWERDEILIEDDNLKDGTTQTNDIRKQTMEMLGVTDALQASTLAKYYLNVNRLLSRSISFEVGIDGVACEAGDVIKFAHDVPQWGASGRILTGSTTAALKLDRSITIETGKTYEIDVRQQGSDGLETANVTQSAGTYAAGSAIAVSNLIGAPTKHAVYSFGVATTQVRLYTVVRVELTESLTRRITAIQYDAAVYSDAPGELENPNVPVIPADTVIPSDVQVLAAIERIEIQEDGSTIPVVDLFWNYADDNPAGVFATVFWRRTDDPVETWTLLAQIEGEAFTQRDYIEAGIEYEFAVAATSIAGARKDPSIAPQIAITPTGLAPFHDGPTALVVNRVGDVLNLAWDGLTEPLPVDFLDYEIRRGGGEWTLATVVGNTSSPSFQTTDFTPGKEYWLVRERNTSKRYSEAQVAILRLANKASESTTLEVNERGDGFTGTKTDVEVATQGWLELSATKTSGTYLSAVKDLGSSATRRFAHRTHVQQDGDETTTTLAAIVVDNSDGLANGAKRDFDGGMTPDFAVVAGWVLEIRFSIDGVVFTDWQQFIEMERTERYFQYRLTLTRSATTFNARAKELSVLVTA